MADEEDWGSDSEDEDYVPTSEDLLFLSFCTLATLKEHC